MTDLKISDFDLSHTLLKQPIREPFKDKVCWKSLLKSRGNVKLN